MKERKNHHRKRSRSVARPGRTILLLLVTAAGILGGLWCGRQTAERRLRAETEQTAAEEEWTAALAEKAAHDPADPAGAAWWTAGEQSVLDEARDAAAAREAELDRIRAERDAVEAAIEETWAEGDNAYYRTVYEAYEEGIAYVEELMEQG